MEDLKIALYVGLILVLLGVGLFVSVEEKWLVIPWLPPILPPSPVLIPVISQNQFGTNEYADGVNVTCYSDIDGPQSVTTIGNNIVGAPRLSLRPTISYIFVASISKANLYSNMTKVIMMPSDLSNYEIYVEIYYATSYPLPTVLYIAKMELRSW